MMIKKTGQRRVQKLVMYKEVFVYFFLYFSLNYLNCRSKKNVEPCKDFLTFIKIQILRLKFKISSLSLRKKRIFVICVDITLTEGSRGIMLTNCSFKVEKLSPSLFDIFMKIFLRSWVHVNPLSGTSTNPRLIRVSTDS